MLQQIVIETSTREILESIKFMKLKVISLLRKKKKED